MQISPWVIALGAVLFVSDPAMAQERRKDDSRRTEARQPASADSGARERDTTRGTTGRVPRRETPPPRPRDDDRDRDRGRDLEERRILRPITVLSPRMDLDAYGRSYDRSYGRRVWGRVGGMSCLQLDDELEWAHDEWHYRNDRRRGTNAYDLEHARLEYRIAQERAHSNCGRAHRDRDCRDRGRYPRSGSSLEIALIVLDILLGRY